MSFRFHPWATFFSLVGLVLLLALGTWQLNRYLDARDFERQRDGRIDQPVVELEDPDRLATGEFDFRRVTVEGRWDEERLFLIKHRVYDGDPGYWIVRPLLLFEDADDSPAVLPVNVGWVPRQNGPDQARELIEEQSKETVTITGLVHLVDDVVADDTFRRSLDETAHPAGIIELDTYDIEAVTRAHPDSSFDRPVVLTRSPDDTDDEPPVASHDHITDPYLTSDTHFGYMLTWYSLAVALLVIWFAHGLGLLQSRSYDRPADDDR